MKVVYVQPDQYAEIVEIDGCLEKYQEMVDGYIECVYPWDEAVGIICNEEGKINGLPLNRPLRDDDGDIYDIICGSFLIVGLTEDDFRNLTDEQAERYKAMFCEPNSFIQANGKIIVI